MIRVAAPADAEAILDVLQAFVAESSYGMTFDRAGAASYLGMLIEHPEVAIFINDEVTALIIVTVTKDWCVQPVCYVEKMFLHPVARGSGVARLLVAAAVEFARQHGCSHVFATATAGMGDTVSTLFANLFGKFGFKPCGPVLFRGM